MTMKAQVLLNCLFWNQGDGPKYKIGTIAAKL